MNPNPDSACHEGAPEIDEDGMGWWWGYCPCGHEVGPRMFHQVIVDEIERHRAPAQINGSAGVS